jgi:LysR family glycine cleavage system transcriptional activator
MRKLPSLQSLRAFEAAARLQSFLLASEELHLTPSAISHQVRGLEAYLGQNLFTRSNRRVELTDSGARLLGTLSTVFDMVEEACLDLSPNAVVESLSVHCTPSFASKWLGPRLAGFMREFPDLTIRMSSSAEPVNMLQEEELDVAIAYGSVRRQAGVVVEALGAERTAPLASPTLVGKRFKREDIAKLTLIESKLNPVRWRDWFKENDLKTGRNRRSIVPHWCLPQQLMVSAWRLKAFGSLSASWRTANSSSSAKECTNRLNAKPTFSAIALPTGRPGRYSSFMIGSCANRGV